jgi:serine/threonine protein kinase/tetratricopeptide (TPR) repeat protein
MANQARRMIAGRFEILEQIGQGGMGTVYRAKDTTTNQTVAVKHLRNDFLGQDPDMVERFKREGEALSALNHPNIVKMLTAVDENKEHYLVMEYVSGGSLAELLRATPRLSVQRALYIALDMADALTRAHRLNIIHRDIKPDNILIADDGTPRLTDFGVAHIGTAVRVTQADSVVGTYAYVSPESFNGEEPSARADLWAFGVVLYEMLTGHRPWEDKDLAPLISNIMTKPVPDLQAERPDLPISLVDLVYRLLDKHPGRRINSARMVGAELEAIINGRDNIAAPTIIATDSRFETPTPPTGGSTHHNLPTQATTFVGREQELAELGRLLVDRSARLMTIVGAGGMGKTRLSIEAARRHLDQFHDGVYFVPLAPIELPTLIVPTIADAIKFNFYDESNPKGQLLDHLRNKELLLVMDNFEHIISGAGIVSDILAAAPGVRVLATSRERLNLNGENTLQIQGMDYPTDRNLSVTDARNYPAIKLFVQSAQRIQHDFTLGDDDGEACGEVIRITQLVQGMPLGLELAAAWLEMLSTAEIVSEISKSLDFLESTMRDLPERHRSIRAVFEYSWNTLNSEERTAYQQLSVFNGTFTREAAQHVSGASLRTLVNLVNKSLLYRDSAGRYQVHELLRQYAEERLKADPAAEQSTHERHMQHYVAFLDKQAHALTNEGQPQALDRIEEEASNVRAAWQWAIDRKHFDSIDKASQPLWMYYKIRGLFRDGLEVFNEALTHCQSGDAQLDKTNELIVTRATMYKGNLLHAMGKRDKARELLQSALDTFKRHKSERDEAQALILLSMTMPMYIAEAQQEIRTAIHRALEIGRAYHDQSIIAQALQGLGEVYNSGFNLDPTYPQGIKHLTESVAVWQQLGNIYGQAQAMRALALLLAWANQVDAAEAWMQKGLPLYKEVKSITGIIASKYTLANIEQARGQLVKAEEYLNHALSMARQIGNIPQVANFMGMIAWNAYMLGEYERSIKIGNEAVEMFRNTDYSEAIVGFTFGLTHNHLAIGDYVLAEAALLQGAQDFQDDEGRARSMMMMAHSAILQRSLDLAEQRVQESITIAYRTESAENLGNALDRQGRIAFLRGQYDAAQKLYQESLQYQEQADNNWGRAEAYNGLGEVALQTGTAQEAATHFRRALNAARPVGVMYVQMRSVAGLGKVAATQGQQVQAAMLLTAAHEQNGLWLADRQPLAQDLAALRTQMSAEAYTAAAERGRTTSTADIIADLLAADVTV